MRHFRYALGFMILCTVPLWGAVAFGQGADSPKTGEPPFGEALQGGAKGYKVEGPVVVEFVNNISGMADSAIVTARLRHGGILRTFATEIPGPFDTSNPVANTLFLVEAMEQEVLAGFADQVSGSNLVLKSAEEFGQSTPQGSTSLYTVVNVVLAINDTPE